MKPFNLEAALNGARVVTRDGREVTQLARFDTDKDARCLVGVASGLLMSWYEDGRYSRRDLTPDLSMAPSIKTVFVARYSDGFITRGYDNLFGCQLCNPDAVGYHEIAYEE